MPCRATFIYVCWTHERSLAPRLILRLLIPCFYTDFEIKVVVRIHFHPLPAVATLRLPSAV